MTVDGTGKWHLFYSLMVNACGLLHYQTNSVVKHAISDSGPLGPWVRARALVFEASLCREDGLLVAKAYRELKPGEAYSGFSQQGQVHTLSLPASAGAAR